MSADMTFDEALEKMKAGKKVSRRWYSSDMWLKMQQPDAEKKIKLPYIYFCYEDVLWNPAQGDILADDWFVVV